MIYKIKSQKQLISLIKHCVMLRIFTNGKDVYAWNSEFTDHQHARKMLGGLDESYNSYTIENNGRLLHCIVINYPVLKNFIQTWFPDCWYGFHVKEYDTHEGICLFTNEKPEWASLHHAYNMRIIVLAQPYYKSETKKRTFTLFTEDNEMPFRYPHVHVCVATKNKKYLGVPLRSPYWAEKYKSIFSIRIKNPKVTEKELYTANNLIIEDEVEPDCFKNMSEQEKSELLDLLNCEKFNFWRGYLCNIKNDEAYKEYWQKNAVIFDTIMP